LDCTRSSITTPVRLGGEIEREERNQGAEGPAGKSLRHLNSAQIFISAMAGALNSYGASRCQTKVATARLPMRMPLGCSGVRMLNLSPLS
jgi:hypothetical protein